MARDYERVLDAAEALVSFTGYLDSEDLKQRGVAQGKLNGEVRVFVYNLFRESPDHGPLVFSVSADLDRIAATGHHSEAAIADTRAALLAEIKKRARNSPVVRFLIRWVPPVLGLVALAVYLYVKAQALG
jgi:hypothetical protein